MPNVGKIVSGIAKAAGKKKSAAATKKGLKAAQGPSMAPKGYVTDTARRKAANELRINKAVYGSDGAMRMGSSREAAKIAGSAAPKNVISRSGKVANTTKLIKKAAKNKKK
jgi:hypothetical protein